jgi:hypothetical protein
VEVEDALMPLTRLLNDFATEVRSLYSEKERHDGYIIGHDRNGAAVRMPLMRCSIGVLELPAGVVISDIDRISAEIASVKALAKQSDCGISLTRFGAMLSDTGGSI